MTTLSVDLLANHAYCMVPTVHLANLDRQEIPLNRIRRTKGFASEHNTYFFRAGHSVDGPSPQPKPQYNQSMKSLTSSCMFIWKL